MRTVICIGSGEIDWDAVSAVGSIFASFVALFVAWLALRAPEWGKRADRREGSAEVLSAAEEALGIYNEAHRIAVVEQRWPSEQVIPLRIRAAHLHETLDRLISRPWLTDGVVVVGAGAMSILLAIQNIAVAGELREKKRPQSGLSGVDKVLARFVDARTPAQETVEALKATVDVVQERMGRVRAHAKK